MLTGKRPIFADTKSKVRESIRALGHQPHLGDRVLSKPRTRVIGLVLPPQGGMHLPVATRFVAAAVTTARRYDMDLLLMTADDGTSGLRRAAAVAQIDGFLVMDVELDDSRMPLLRQLSTPSVLIGHPEAANGPTCVDLDFEEAGAKCVGHLADLGHRSIGFLGAPRALYRRNTGFAHRTMAGFGAAAMRRGVMATAVSAEDDRDSMLSAAKILIRVNPSMTALVGHNEAASGWNTGCLRAVNLLVAKLDGERPPPLMLLPPRRSRRASTPALDVPESGAVALGQVLPCRSAR